MRLLLRCFNLITMILRMRIVMMIITIIIIRRTDGAGRVGSEVI